MSQILDVQKLRLLPEPPGAPAGRVLECDVLVAGGGMGGCAAALAACRRGRRVILTEETDWLGGQMTSQGVAALDEHRGAEEFGCTRSYYELRGLIREYYRTCSQLTPEAAANPHLNPGDGWVSYLCFEPKAGLWALDRMLRPFVETGLLTILPRHYAVRAEMDGNTVRSVTFRDLDGDERVEVRAPFVLDATELGDLLPLTGTEYVVGAESADDTGEPNARPDTAPWCQQSFTYPFTLEWRPGERHLLPEPEGHALNRDRQPYTLRHFYHDERGWATYRMFETGHHAAGPFWTYRRLINAANFRDPAYPNDVAMINWPGNDFRHGLIVDVEPAHALESLRRAKLLSLGFAYWLQADCPRDEGGTGYPEMLLRPDVMGTEDGLSKYPYIRECRRIVPRFRVLEQHIAAACRGEARAERFPGSIGVGHYAIDIHPAEGEEKLPPARTRPFQVPLGALIPKRVTNLLAACKNIGTTHITNGAYRLHPIEWNIGEAAGEVAAYCLERGLQPAALDAAAVREVQQRLVRAGVPLYWFTDVPIEHPLFEASQLLAAWGLWTGDPQSLELRPEQPARGTLNIPDWAAHSLCDIPETEIVTAGDLVRVAYGKLTG